MVESNGDRAGMLKMRLFNSKVNMENIRRLVSPRVKPSQFFDADGLGAYGILGSLGHRVTSRPVSKDERTTRLVWVHKAISLAKRFILGTYHGVSGKRLQRYLDEFCFRWNRRFFHGNVFLRLLNTACLAAPVTYAALTG